MLNGQGLTRAVGLEACTYKMEPCTVTGVNLLHRPDKIDSRESFHRYVEAMHRSLEEAVATPSSPYGLAVDHQGVEWVNTRLDQFLEAMNAWMTDWGWTPIDQRDSPVWAALRVTEPFAADEDGLRRYLADLRDWASNPDLARDQHWRPAAQALAAGRSYE